MLTKLSVSISMVVFSLCGTLASATVGIAGTNDKSFKVAYKPTPGSRAQREARWKIDAEQANDSRPTQMIALRAPIDISNAESIAPDTSSVEKVTMPREPASQPRSTHHKKSKKSHSKHAKHTHQKSSK